MVWLRKAENLNFESIVKDNENTSRADIGKVKVMTQEVMKAGGIGLGNGMS